MTRLSLALVLVFGLTGSAAGSEDGDAMLADAAERGDAALVRTLLNADGDVDVDSAQVDGMTALHWAVYRDDADTARLLVQAGADVGVENRYGGVSACSGGDKRQWRPGPAAARVGCRCKRVASRRRVRSHDRRAYRKCRSRRRASRGRSRSQRSRAAKSDGVDCGRQRRDTPPSSVRSSRLGPISTRVSSPDSRRCSSPCVRAGSKLPTRC